MAALPSYVRLLLNGATEQFDPSVVRTEMDRGLPKQRLKNTQVLMKVAGKLFFRTQADTIAFDTWYFDTIGRIGWFDIRDARYGVTRTVRFEGGNIGTLTPITASYAMATHAVTLEYLR